MHATLYKLEEMEHDALSGEIGVIEERIRFQEELESESIVEMREPGEMEEVERLNVLRAKREALGLKMHKRMEERNKVEGFRRQIEKAARKAGVDIGKQRGE